LKIYIEGSDPVTLTANSGVTWVARWLPVERREVTIEVLEGRAGVAALTVRRELPTSLLWVTLALLAAVALGFVVLRLARLVGSLRKPTYEPEVRFPAPDEPPVYPRRRLWRGVKD
jgi:hypothetical protein